MSNDPFAYPPRGMSRVAAARYIGVGTTKFDELVASRQMPRPKRIGGRVVWDRVQLDACFDELTEGAKTPAQMALEKFRQQ